MFFLTGEVKGRVNGDKLLKLYEKMSMLFLEVSIHIAGFY